MLELADVAYIPGVLVIKATRTLTDDELATIVAEAQGKWDIGGDDEVVIVNPETTRGYEQRWRGMKISGGLN